MTHVVLSDKWPVSCCLQEAEIETFENMLYLRVRDPAGCFLQLRVRDPACYALKIFFGMHPCSAAGSRTVLSPAQGAGSRTLSLENIFHFRQALWGVLLGYLHDS